MRPKILAVAAAAWLVASGAAEQSPIVVHHIGPLTGMLAASNKEALDGAKLYLDALNARGGVQGRPVQLQTLDDAQDPEKTVEHLQTLIAGNQLLALMLPRTTPSTDALLPVSAQQGVPVIGPQAGGSAINQPPRREVLTLRASYQKEAETAIRQQR